MTRPVRSDELPKVVTTLRHTGELVGHPCHCGRKNCTIGEHVWKATKSMGPGPRAANLDPAARGWRYDEDGEPIRGDDPTGEAATDLELADLHVEYMTLLNEATHWATRLGEFLDRWRPDREVHVVDDDDFDRRWCRNCMGHNVFNPRHRGEGAAARCRGCYEFWLAYKPHDRTGDLIRAEHEGRKITQQMVDAAVREARSALRSKRKRRKAG